MRKSASKSTETREFNYREIDWELRPGGMLVQKMGGVGDGSSRPMIKIKVSHGLCHYDIAVPAQSTFGDLKKVLAHETGLESTEQRLLFKGKEKEDDEYLHMVGVSGMSKVILFEDPASKARKLEEMKRNQDSLKAYEAVARVRAEVDELCEKVAALETNFRGGTKIAEKEFSVLIELLMIQLLKLDSIEADGQAKVQRKIEVRRIQSFVDTLENLKARSSNSFSHNSNAVSVTTKWETFASGVGSLSAPVPIQSATKLTRDWERFD
ncbi:hypothetical protein DKX38_024908 [Salix brachista]|uniref:Ubiquitin-like domain-containing protein n=1 Tax=Salix brachista TaxID=2182728 RepID=A0A5N5JMX0_9ROSI|nr:hypothetical protein DKX38_024908 [Salix brachista]